TWSGINAIGVDPVDSSVYVVDAGNSRVVKFDANGTMLFAIDSATSAPGQLGYWWYDSGPKKWKTYMGGVAVDPLTQYVWISDPAQVNERVQVFDKNGVWVASFGGVGNGGGLFNEPAGIAIDDASNRVYVL